MAPTAERAVGALGVGRRRRHPQRVVPPRGSAVVASARQGEETDTTAPATGAVVADRFGEMAWREVYDHAEALRDLAEDLGEHHDYAHDLLRDVFTAAYRVAPKVRADLRLRTMNSRPQRGSSWPSSRPKNSRPLAMYSPRAGI